MANDRLIDIAVTKVIVLTTAPGSPTAPTVAELTAATGYAERDCAAEMLARLPASRRRRTVAGDKGYDTRDFVAQTRQLGFTPHVAPNTTNRRSAIDGRTTRHTGHLVSQRIRKRIEECFGWGKPIGQVR